MSIAVAAEVLVTDGANTLAVSELTQCLLNIQDRTG